MVTTIRLPEELHSKLKRNAKKQGMTFNGYVLSILWKSVQTMCHNGKCSFDDTNMP